MIWAAECCECSTSHLLVATALLSDVALGAPARRNHPAAAGEQKCAMGQRLRTDLCTEPTHFNLKIFWPFVASPAGASAKEAI
jgi:hypothetical protein